MNKFTLRQTTVAAFLLLIVLLPAYEGCSPVKLKTIELRPVQTMTGPSAMAGSIGWCVSRGDSPPPFIPGPGQVMVGFDNFFKPGTPPLPCDNVRAAVYRGGVFFDLSQFDAIVSADFLMDTVNSVSRSGGEFVGTTPPISYATTLGIATQPFSREMFFDNDVPLPAGPTIDLDVSIDVRAWVDKVRPNFGFVLAGPTELVDRANPPKNNDAKISWYGNFRLRIIYNPALNPRAPQ